MGQDISKDDLTFVDTTDEHLKTSVSENTQTARTVDELLEEISKRIVKYRSGAPSSEIVFYTRQRTDYGAPTINKMSYNEKEIKQFEDFNDGFPLAATVDEIREFDNLLINGKRRKTKKKQRSRSFTEVLSEASRRLPALTRPRFVEKIITGYSSLTKRSPGRPKKYLRRHLSLDHSRLCLDSSTKDLVADQDGIRENCNEIAASVSVKFCFNCDLPVIFDDVKLCLFNFEVSRIICLACQQLQGNKQCISNDVASEDLDTVSQIPTAKAAEWQPDADKFQVSGEESSEQFENDSTLKTLSSTFSELIVRQDEHFEGTEETETYPEVLDSSPNITDPEPSNAKSYFNNEEYQTRHETGHETGHETEPGILDSLPDVSESESPIVQGHVKQKCEAFTQSQGRQLQRSKTERPVGIETVQFRYIQNRHLDIHADQSNRRSKNYYSLARDKTFSKAVMAKGYVKALAEQINQQGSLKQVRDEETEIEELNNDMAKSTSSVASCMSDEIPFHLVHTLIQAAEQNKFKEDDSSSPVRKQDIQSINNTLESSCAQLANHHLVTDAFKLTNCGESLTTNEKLFYNKDNELIPACEASINSQLSQPQGMNSSSQLSQFQGMNSPTSSSEISPISSPRVSPAGGSPCAHKPSVDYDRKPKIRRNLHRQQPHKMLAEYQHN